MRIFFVIQIIIILYFNGYSQDTLIMPFKIDQTAIGIIRDSTKKVLGTGFVFGKPSMVVTCYHVDTASTYPKSFQPIGSKQQFPLRLVYSHPKGDLAAYQCDSTAITLNYLLPDTNFSIDLRDTVFFYHYSVDTVDNQPQLKFYAKHSYIEAWGKMDNKRSRVSFVEFGADAIPGNSGTPVWNYSGKVIAMISSGYDRISLKDGTSTGIFVRAYAIRNFVEWFYKKKFR